jgi:two-component system phosphate regulon sensor histidine kinase PhoR
MILIKVTDKGLGMSRFLKKEFFKKFYRNIQETYIMLRPGLGLAYVKRIVEDHNGQVYVESEREKEVLHNKIPLIN